MSTPDEARAAQIRNIEVKTGHSLAALRAAVQGSGKVKHGEVRAWLIETYGLGYGDANGLAAASLADPAATTPLAEDVLGEIYAGKKVHLRAIHDAVMAALAPFGPFELAPRKGYGALRRKKQFAMLGAQDRRPRGARNQPED